MKNEELFQIMDELYPEYLDVWENLCKIESPSSDKAGVDAVGSYVMEIAKDHGWRIEIHKEDVSGDAISITMNPEAQAYPIAVSAHMDTVHPKGSFGESVTMRDKENLYAPGALDCKGGIAQALFAMHSLEKLGFRERPIILLLQSDEEIGSRTSEKRTVKFMADKAKDAIGFFNLEGSSPGYACVKRKGIIYYTFKIKGVEAHSGNCAIAGANAILEAAHKIIEIEKIKDHEGITCNCGVIKGGTVPNTVPGECEFCVNIRYSNQKELEEITARIEEIEKEVYVPGCVTKAYKTGFRVAMEMSEKNLSLLSKVNKIFEENELSTLLPGRGNGGSDAADISSYGIPCIDSISVTGGNVHSPSEFAALKSLLDSSKRLALIILNLK